MSTQTDFSEKQDVSNNQVRSRKQGSSIKQVRSIKQDSSNNSIVDTDLDLLCDKLRDLLEKPVKSESDNLITEMIIDKVLRVKAITKRQ